MTEENYGTGEPVFGPHLNPGHPEHGVLTTNSDVRWLSRSVGQSVSQW